MIINKSNIIKKLDELNNKINSKNKISENNFYKCFHDMIKQINNNCIKAEKETEKFKLEDFFNKNSLSDIILNLEKSSLSIQMLIKLKDKVISAYKEIMNMQI
ncbi:flagellar hook-basal body complex protein FliE [Buchnera aphidicola (Ceratoglyphina bambusae)]|uniref:flagellar hook-basal body complex protein FliE n=1 Tax=Buchnera aphidicola TaxID=9 RepID=UPI0031B87608